MAFITYPLNNIDYTAEDAELFHCTRTSGIWAEDSFPISVTGADNNITIGKGIAWINNEEFSGKVAALKSAEVLDLGIADSTYPKIDIIAIQFNANKNETDVIVKKGTPATNPVRPAIVRTGAIYELYLASIYRPAGATAVTASNITDLRMDKTVCGLMADSVTSVDTSAIDAQVKALIANLEAEIQGVKDTSGLMFESEWVNNGAIPISKGGTGANNAEKALANLGGMSMELIWENARPTSEFAAQLIPLDLSKYDLVYITSLYNTSSSTRFSSKIIKKGSYEMLEFFMNGTSTTSANVSLLSRKTDVSDSGVNFGNMIQKSLNDNTAGTTKNIYVIPVHIYGIKGVQ